MPWFKQWETVFNAKSYSVFMPGLSQYFPPRLCSNSALLNHEGLNNSWSISSSPSGFWPVKSTVPCIKKKKRKLEEGDKRTGNKRLKKMDIEILNASAESSFTTWNNWVSTTLCLTFLRNPLLTPYSLARDFLTWKC